MKSPNVIPRVGPAICVGNVYAVETKGRFFISVSLEKSYGPPPNKNVTKAF